MGCTPNKTEIDPWRKSLRSRMRCSTSSLKSAQSPSKNNHRCIEEDQLKEELGKIFDQYDEDGNGFLREK